MRRLVLMTNTSITKRLFRLFCILCLIITAHTSAMMVFEGLALRQALWLSLTTITTVGYGDTSASTPLGQLATVCLIYILGIWMLAQLAGEYLDYRIERRERMIKGQWRWHDMADHILIFNTPAIDGDLYLLRLITQLRKTPTLSDCPIEIVTDTYPEGLPAELRDLGVVHSHRNVTRDINFDDFNIREAKYILVLCADIQNTQSDSISLDILDRINHIEHNAQVVTECIIDENKPRFKRLGSHAVIRPVRAYPELIVRALYSPGAEEILENLFKHEGASTHRFDITIDNQRWGAIACALIEHGIGTPLGYVANDGGIITNPAPDIFIDASAIIMIVNENKIPMQTEVASCIAGCSK